MSAKIASGLGRQGAGIVVLASSVLMGFLSMLFSFLGLPDLDRIRELLQKIQEMLTLGGMTLALIVSIAFIATWVLTHLRQPKNVARPFLPFCALSFSYIPVALTLVAAMGMFIPMLAPLTLKAFAWAVLGAAISWALGVIAVIVGGQRKDLKRARKALLLSGTPWYCLSVWISTLLWH